MSGLRGLAGLAGIVGGAPPAPPRISYSLFSNIGAPTYVDDSPYELGLRFSPLVNGQISHIRYYKAPQEQSGGHVGRLWDVGTQALLSSVAFAAETASGWQSQALPSPVQVVAGGNYLVSVNIFSAYATIGLPMYEESTIRSIYLPVWPTAYGAPGTYPGSDYHENFLRDFVFVED